VGLATLGEESQPVAHHDGVEAQVELVDQVALEQPPEQLAAAMDLELAPGLRLAVSFMSSLLAAHSDDQTAWPPETHR
jgi:hypothetical protein